MEHRKLRSSLWPSLGELNLVVALDDSPLWGEDDGGIK
jgi:hypothetical protein